uniref:Protein JASON n=1 Tax=Oryza punctata TaxID=4537 RepID=A0A0E0JW17_ORYPU
MKYTTLEQSQRLKGHSAHQKAKAQQEVENGPTTKSLPIRPHLLSLFVSIQFKIPSTFSSASPLLTILPFSSLSRRLQTLLLLRGGDDGGVGGGRTMGCFLSCFRGAGSDPAAAGGLRDPLVRESWIGEAFLDDETKVEASGTLDGDRGNGGSVDEELMREANYLKSCGAIGETPPEMLKGSNQITEEETNGELKGTAVSEENISEGFNCDEHSVLKHEQYTDEGTDHLLEVESVPQSSLQHKSSRQNIRNQRLDSNDSPHPTPLVLRGDMQTPDSARKGVASLSCWLKPPSSAGGSQSDTEGKVVKQRCYENSVFTDLPIFTASGLNWDSDKPTPVLPKVWDGNGIPNTTTKYKEDQKVSWHATPFEERLLKVLSDEKPHHQRFLLML